MASPPGPEIAQELCNFLNAAWTPFHATNEAKQRLLAAGFLQLSEREPWSLASGGKYFFTRNMSTIVAFALGRKYQPGNGFLVIGAHTDSPCPKLKPISKATKGGCLMVGVQTYGGGLWHTWFDRDLSIAGRVMVRREGGGITHELVKVNRPIMRIPTLAIHLDRGVNDSGFKVNTQTNLPPLLATAIKAELSRSPPRTAVVVGPANTADSIATAEAPAGGSSEKKEKDTGPHHSILLQVLAPYCPVTIEQILAEELRCQPAEIADFELQCCDTQPSLIGGACNEFVFSGRLDNLCMSFCALKALLESSSDTALENEVGVRMVALFDHEEVGSDSAQGAGSPVLADALRRVTASVTDSGADARALLEQSIFERAVQKSFVVSADMAHCLHPNYQDRHEEAHQPHMHKGLVIKTNANQRYATNAFTSFVFREIARRHDLPVQDFVVRTDMACGSTIGPILASGLGLRTVDVGAPQLSMHSVREMCGTDDVAYAYLHFKAFFEDFSLLDSTIRVDDN